MNLRKIQAKDMDQVIQLSNRVFRTPIPMEDAFPLLFNINNKHSFLIEENDKVISFVGIVPIKFKNMLGVSIGAVCTEPDYQGQGILGTYFPEILKDLESSVDFALISGAGKLYSNNGAVKYGSFNKHHIKPVENTKTQYKLYNGSINDLKIIDNLIVKQENTFDYGINELDILLESQGYAGITGQKQVICLAEDQSAFVILGIKNNIGKVIDYGGNNENIISIIESYAYTESLESISWVLDSKLKKYESVKTENQGTIIYFKENRNKLPYTGGLRFI